MGISKLRNGASATLKQQGPAGRKSIKIATKIVAVQYIFFPYALPLASAGVGGYIYIYYMHVIHVVGISDISHMLVQPRQPVCSTTSCWLSWRRIFTIFLCLQFSFPDSRWGLPFGWASKAWEAVAGLTLKLIRTLSGFAVPNHTAYIQVGFGTVPKLMFAIAALCRCSGSIELMIIELNWYAIKLYKVDFF